MTGKRTSIVVAALILLVLAAVTGYLLYAIPESDADRLSRQVATLRSDQARLARELAAANRRAAAANTQARYDAGYADGYSAAFGPFGNDWTDGAFYVVRIDAGASGRYRIAARAVLRECLAVYARNGAIFARGRAC